MIATLVPEGNWGKHAMMFILFTIKGKKENKQRFLQERPCIIEFIKRVGGQDKMRGFAERLIGFPQRV